MTENPFIRSTTGSDIVIRYAGHRVRVRPEWQQLAERIVAHLLETIPDSVSVKRVMVETDSELPRQKKKISRKRESKSEGESFWDSQTEAPTAHGEEV